MGELLDELAEEPRVMEVESRESWGWDGDAGIGVEDASSYGKGVLVVLALEKAL